MTEKLYDEKRLIQIEENLKKIRNDIAETAIKNGRNTEDVKLMAVTKTVEPVYINHAIKNGIDLIGENRVQEFLSKKDELNLENCSAHLIGHLQTNKVRQIVGQVDMIQSVDSVHLAKEISERSCRLGISTDVLLEVNIGNEESKSGLDKEKVIETAHEISEFGNINICGLMAIPPFDANEENTRVFFYNMHKLFIDIQSKKMDNINMTVLSMGMSGDYKAAISEGSNLVRIGSAIFGSRT